MCNKSVSTAEGPGQEHYYYYSGLINTFMFPLRRGTCQSLNYFVRNIDLLSIWSKF